MMRSNCFTLCNGEIKYLPIINIPFDNSFMFPQNSLRKKINGKPKYLKYLSIMVILYKEKVLNSHMCKKYLHIPSKAHAIMFNIIFQ